jgi:hypothetical protein
MALASSARATGLWSSAARSAPSGNRSTPIVLTCGCSAVVPCFFVSVSLDSMQTRRKQPATIRSRAACLPAGPGALFSDDPPQYMERGPFSYTDPGPVERDLRAAGFTEIHVETVMLSSQVTAGDAARGLVLGSPFRAEIEHRDPAALERALEAVANALQRWDGEDAPMSAHVVTARS